MRVVVIGTGGREHALAWKINQSESLTELFVLPGNPGTKAFANNVDVNPSNFDDVLSFCKEEEIDLVVIGPEQPLVDGLADMFRENNVAVFGPNKAAAVIEGNKAFSKDLMKKYDIPTAAYEVFSKEDYEKAVTYLLKSNYPIVIKASGLAAGKGVAICQNYEEAINSLDGCFKDAKFGSSGDVVVIEEFLVGEEASVFAITDGENFVTLPASQDHKAVYDCDKGPNTGGMGAYAPAPVVDEALMMEIEEKVIKPTLAAMKTEDRTYSGCLYCGLMITENGPKVIEFNCRFGDPETQVVLPILKGDFLKLLYSSAKGELEECVEYNEGSSVCVVLASKGYPGSYEKGFEIVGLDENIEDVVVFHAGTKEKDGIIVTNGGRVLGITSISKEGNLTDAKKIAYKAVNRICFNNIYYRKDISDKAKKYLH